MITFSHYDAMQHWVLSYLLNSLWQVPLIFLAAWLAAYFLRQAEARITHRGLGGRHNSRSHIAGMQLQHPAMVE